MNDLRKPRRIIVGGVLTATADDLSLNFVGGDGGLTFNGANGVPYPPFITFEASGGVIPNPYIVVQDPNSTGSSYTEAQFNPPTDIIATAITPEPSTAILWLTGIGLMILMRKRITLLLRPSPGTRGSLSPH
jgi:hypothetical protein